MNGYGSFINNAYLLGCDGRVIPVENHPLVQYEFDDIVYVLSEYGDNTTKHLALEYDSNPSEELKQALLEIYNNTWCKVREWENGRLVTFRIISTNSFNWYPVILKFLLDNPGYTNSNVTVESDKSTGFRKTFWEELPYTNAISPEYETILATTRC